MCLERAAKGRDRPVTSERRPRLASACRVAPKKGDNLPPAERESAPWHGFPRVSWSFVTDLDPPVEFTISQFFGKKTEEQKR